LTQAASNVAPQFLHRDTGARICSFGLNMRFAVFLLSLPLLANPLPRVEAESLTGQKLVLPDALRGQPAVVVWSFSREAGEKVDKWAASLARDRVNVWSAAVIEAAPRLIRPMIRASMRRASPEPFHPRFLCVTRGEKELRAALGVSNDKLPLVTLLGPDGAVLWRHSGGYDPEAEAELRRRLAGRR